GRVLAARGAHGRFRSTRVSRDASEPRNARATAPCVVAGGAPLLRGGDAGARRAAARSRVGGDAPTRSLLKRGVSGARARAEFFYLQSATRNSTGSPLVPAYCFLAHVDGWRSNAVVSRRGGRRWGGVVCLAWRSHGGQAWWGEGLEEFSPAVEVASGQLPRRTVPGRRRGGGCATPSGARRKSACAANCPRKIMRPGSRRCARQAGRTARSRSRPRAASSGTG